MRIVKASVYRSPNRSPEQGVVVFEDSDGWLYLKALVKLEGFTTSFFSLEEVEACVGESLTLDYWQELDDQGKVIALHHANTRGDEDG